MAKHVYVITKPDLGWDCVVAVMSAKAYATEKEAIKAYLEDNDISLKYTEDYIAHYEEVQN